MASGTDEFFSTAFERLSSGIEMTGFNILEKKLPSRIVSTLNQGWAFIKIKTMPTTASPSKNPKTKPKNLSKSLKISPPKIF